MIEWRQITEGLSNTFQNLISSGLDNVSVEEVADSYVLIKTHGIRETLIFLDSFGLPTQAFGRFPLSYHCCNEFDGQRIAFPIVSGSCLDFYEGNKKAIEKGVYFCFFYSSREESTKKFKYNVLELLKKNGLNERSIVLIPIVGQVIGEDIGELVSILFFRNKGLLATNHKYWLQGAKAPDVICWRTPLVKKLAEMGILVDGGTLVELAFARVLKRVKSKIVDMEETTAVVEVESSKPHSSISKAVSQLLRDPQSSRYLLTGFFDEGYAMCPFDFYHDSEVGVLSFDEKGIKFHSCPKNYSTENREFFIRQTNEVIKQTLMMNFTLDEIFRMVGQSSSVYGLLKSIHELDVKRVLEAIIE